MTDYINYTLEDYSKQVQVRLLPYDVTAKEIGNVFERFGNFVKLYLRRRVSKNSNVYLRNPTVTLAFDSIDNVDRLMESRPFSIGNHELYVRRVLPINENHSDDGVFTIKGLHMYVDTRIKNIILPDDNAIFDYLKTINGKIVSLERLNNQNVLIFFDDYDPVDKLCLLRPHIIKNVSVEVDKCIDEKLIRYKVSCDSEKLDSASIEQSSNLPIDNMDNQTMNISSKIPDSTIEEQMKIFRTNYEELSNRLELEHQELIGELNEEWNKISKERIRFERLALDYRKRSERLSKENQKLQGLFSASMKEHLEIQGKHKELKIRCEQTRKPDVGQPSTNLN